MVFPQEHELFVEVRSKGTQVAAVMKSFKNATFPGAIRPLDDNKFFIKGKFCIGKATKVVKSKLSNNHE